jgi:hypothetical protein
MPAGSDGCVKILLHKGNLRVNTHLDSRAKDAPLVRLCNLTLISAWKNPKSSGPPSEQQSDGQQSNKSKVSQSCLFSHLFLDLASDCFAAVLCHDLRCCALLLVDQKRASLLKPPPFFQFH